MFLYDVAIIGAGAVGCAVARELARFKLSVAVLERETDVGFGASKANSGIVHAGFHDRPGTLKARLCLEGSRLYPGLAGELDVSFKQNGAVMVARVAEDLPRLAEYQERGRRNGLTDLRLIDRDDLFRLEPNLSRTLLGALLVPDNAIVAPFELTMAMAENARANGVSFHLGAPVIGIERTANSLIVQTCAGPHAARFVINAAGSAAGRLAALIGDETVALGLRKGEEYLLDRRLAGFITRTVYPLPGSVSKGILLIPTVEGHVMLGPTAEEIREEDPATTARGWREVWERASELAPGLNERDLIASFTGLRATPPGGDFLIAPSVVDARILNAAGIESPGLTAAPAIAVYLRELLREAGLRLAPNPAFHPERRVVRFRLLPPEEQYRLTRADPSYGRIVCRCETVTEAEVVAAIRAGATTVDGVKFRTRAGMGRCQGGFCLPRVLEILARELGREPAELTKRGPGTWLVAGRTRGGGGEWVSG